MNRLELIPSLLRLTGIPLFVSLFEKLPFHEMLASDVVGVAIFSKPAKYLVKDSKPPPYETTGYWLPDILLE